MGTQIFFSIIAGIVSGLISSGLFFWIMSRLQPKMLISECICKGEDKNGTFYGFKILNLTKHNIIDLRLEVQLKTPFNSNGGSNFSMEWIKLKKDYILQFPKYDPNDKNADYALIVATRDNLEELWCDPAQHLEMRIYGKHALSGIRKSFTQKYYTKKNCIKAGLFNFGKTFDIS